MYSVVFFILSVPVFIILLLFTFIIVLIVLFLSIFKLNKAIVTVVNFWARTTFLLTGKKLNIIGKEKIPENHKYILIANHGSLFDIMAIMSFFPNVSWLGKEGLMKVPLFGNALKAINYVPMKSTDLKNTKDMISQLIKNSGAKTIAIFPEGTRTLNGELGKFKKGFLHVFRATETDILPVTLNGFYNFKPKNRFFIKFNSKLTVVVNDILKSEQLLSKTNEEILDEVQNVIALSYQNSSK